MLIRSQDNKQIINFNKAESIVLRNIENSTLIWCGPHIIGEYSTEEKAIAVLDMIENAIWTDRFFQMPADEEVEEQ